MGKGLKERIEAAVLKSEKKAWDEIKPRGGKRVRSKNKKPEQLVVDQIKSWLKTNGFKYNVVEAKGTYSVKAGTYTGGQVDSGFSDIVATDRNGIACFIEVKAKGRRSTLKGHQRKFLVDRINCKAFCGCFDSVDNLSKTYKQYIELRLKKQCTIDYLLGCLPVDKSVDKSNINDELGF